MQFIPDEEDPYGLLSTLLDALPPGSYLVRVDMASACGAAAADFVLTVRVDGAVTQTVKGRLLALQADGGGPGSGLFVAQLSF